jgi:hypothetical protein
MQSFPHHTLQWLGMEKSTVSGKKYTAYFRDTSTGKEFKTHFGAAGSEDYTMHHDPKRRQNYLNRHEKDLDTMDPSRAGYLSYYITWGPSTNLQQNVKSFLRKFRIPDKSNQRQK